MKNECFMKEYHMKKMALGVVTTMVLASVCLGQASSKRTQLKAKIEELAKATSAREALELEQKDLPNKRKKTEDARTEAEAESAKEALAADVAEKEVTSARVREVDALNAYKGALGTKPPDLAAIQKAKEAYEEAKASLAKTQRDLASKKVASEKFDQEEKRLARLVSEMDLRQLEIPAELTKAKTGESQLTAEVEALKREVLFENSESAADNSKKAADVVADPSVVSNAQLLKELRNLAGEVKGLREQASSIKDDTAETRRLAVSIEGLAKANGEAIKAAGTFRLSDEDLKKFSKQLAEENARQKLLAESAPKGPPSSELKELLEKMADAFEGRLKNYAASTSGQQWEVVEEEVTYIYSNGCRRQGVKYVLREKK